MSDELELTPQQVLVLSDKTWCRLNAPVERKVIVIDAGDKTPKQQMDYIVKWRKYLRRFLAT